MSESPPPAGSLVLYKGRCARVAATGPKLHIETEDGADVRVRPKDIVLLHPGPVRPWPPVPPEDGDWDTAWELLQVQTTTLAELAELACGEFTPAAALAAWRQAAEGIRFRGAPDAIEARTAEEAARDEAAREAKAERKRAWDAFAARVEAGAWAEEDAEFLEEIERRALGQIPSSEVLRRLRRDDTPENAHALLLKLKRWDYTVNPYPARLGVAAHAPEIELPELPDEDREDLTHLPAFAIDDEGNEDPDDAVSWDGERLWVHVADAAALVPADSPADLEARARGASLYLPEGAAPMLPRAAAQRLGLGLHDESPALSFALELDAEGRVVRAEPVLSRVRVTRLTYAEADERLEEEPLRTLREIARRFEARRAANGALAIELPEARLRVEDGRVRIESLPPRPSRALVTEAMLMAGEGAARWAMENGVAFPFTAQAPAGAHEQLPRMAGMYAAMRALAPSQPRTEPAPHAGLGLDLYAQVTSPLRRYLDLVAHQQLRARLRGETPLDEAALMERVGAAIAASSLVRKAERLSRRHWTIVYLLQQEAWSGEAIVVDRRERTASVLLPELAFEARVRVRKDLPLNARLRVAFVGANLAELDAQFEVIEELPAAR